MSRRHRCAYGLILSIIILSVFASGSRAENVSGSFSETGNGARSIGMGGAFVAVADDAYAMSVNPAGLALMDRVSVTFDYANLFGLGLLKQSYFGAVFPTNFGVHGLFYQGLQVEFKPFPQTLNETTLGYTYAKAIGPWAIGTTLKYMDLTSDFEQGTATGFGLDLGARYQATTRWSFGGSIRDLYSSLTFGSGTSEAIPVSWRMGSAYRISDKWLVSGEYSGISGDFFSKFRAGTEYWIMRPSFVTRDNRPNDSIFKSPELSQYPLSLGVRAGFEKQLTGSKAFLPAAGFTGGYGSVRLDYAYMFAGKGVGETNRFSLTYDFSPWEKRPASNDASTDNMRDAPKTREPDHFAAPASTRSVAVLDFANATGDRSLSWLEPGLADIVAKELSRSGYQVSPRTALVGTSSIAGPEILALASQLGARLVVRGLFVKSATGTMVLTARIIDGKTGRTLDFVEAEAGESEIFTLGRSIAQAITAKTGAWLQ